MKVFITGLLLVFISSHGLSGQVQFDRYFKDQTMRVDYSRSGNATSDSAELDSIYAYGIWAGSKSNLIDRFNYGQSFYKIIDKQTDQLVYSKGFDSYFKEYQTTDRAIAGEVKTFYESALIPHPIRPFFFVLERRDSLDQFHEVLKTEIDPTKDVFPLKRDDKSVEVFTVIENGKPEEKVDIVIIGEGYTTDEMQKFERDLERATHNFFEIEPLKSHRDKFNVRGVLKPSVHSGLSDPGAGYIKNTALSATFGTLGIDRYLLTEDLKAVNDVAAYVPYDAIFIMVNSEKYGGGGIYNFYCTFTSDHVQSAFLMVHEFGHSFFGLGDEYYSSSTAYNNFYPEGYEPLPPNITAHTNRETLKWKSLLSDSIKLPTPWNKARYDAAQIAWQEESARLNAAILKLEMDKAPIAEISAKHNEYNAKNSAHMTVIREILSNTQLAGKVGAFEGAGYESEGLYRPALTCIMFTQEDYFCPVCEAAMIEMMNGYTGQ